MISVGNHHSNPERNGIPGHPFLPLSLRDKETGALRPELFHPTEITFESFDEAEQHLASVFIHKASDGTVNSSICGLYMEGFWVMAMKSGKNIKVQDLHLLQ